MGRAVSILSVTVFILLIIVAFVVALAIALDTLRPTAAEWVPTASPQPFYYAVRKGDTLASIAERYGTTAWQIAEANGIRNINYIYAGMRLLIPIVSTPVSDPRFEITWMTRFAIGGTQRVRAELIIPQNATVSSDPVPRADVLSEKGTPEGITHTLIYEPVTIYPIMYVTLDAPSCTLSEVPDMDLRAVSSRSYAYSIVWTWTMLCEKPKGQRVTFQLMGQEDAKKDTLPNNVVDRDLEFYVDPEQWYEKIFNQAIGNFALLAVTIIGTIATFFMNRDANERTRAEVDRLERRLEQLELGRSVRSDTQRADLPQGTMPTAMPSEPEA